jgi:uncharacterized protein (TIGR02453 family)
MAYFNQAFIDFFKGLAANNHKDWFDDNRKIYEKEVKKPFYQLVADSIAEVGKLDKNIADLQVKNSVFRINRDIRFSKDKTPYNLHVSAALSPTGRKNMEYPGMYIHLNIDTCNFGGGCYMPSKENLENIRRFIVSNPKEVETALADKAFVDTFGELEPGEKNKILPKEFKEFGEQYPLLFNKQFYYMANYAGEETILRTDLLPFIVNHFRAATAFNDVLKKAMK